MLGRELENTELVRKAQRSQFYAGGRAENPVDQNSEYRTRPNKGQFLQPLCFLRPGSLSEPDPPGTTDRVFAMRLSYPFARTQNGPSQLVT